MSDLAGARPLEHKQPHTLTIAGVVVPCPRDPAENIRHRKWLWDQADAEPETWIPHLRGLCSQRSADSLIYWVNLFARTYVLQEIMPDGTERPLKGEASHQEFITYPYQDELLREMFDGIVHGHDMAVDKTRKMGLSWLILTTFHWFWQFQPDVHFLEVSRKEDLVDKPDDPDSLFWKHDYLLKHQPRWLRPRFTRRTLSLVNDDNGSSIMGSSTTGDVGHGGRKTAMLLDEMARMREAKKAWEGAGQMTSCRIGNSTPHGPGFWADLVRSGKVRVLRAPFYDHPLFGRGRYVKTENGKRIISSPWRDAHVARAVSRREVAEGIDMDHMGAGYVFFDHDQLERHIASSCRPPLYTGGIRFVGSGDRVVHLRKRGQEIEFDADAPDPAWKLWTELEFDRSWGKDGGWRPPQARTYVFGIDVAYGTTASNSVICVKEVETGEQVGEFASATVDPVELAMLAMEAGYWFGGAGGQAFIAWESNGGGGQNVTRKMREFGYPWLYSFVDARKRAEEITDTLGWASNPERKADALGVFRGALARDEFTPRSDMLMHEAKQYIWFETGGGVGPAQLEQESSAAEATHGDRVIAAMLAELASKQARRTKPKDRPPPPSSMAERMEAAKRERTQKRVGRRV